tara:strand:- start:331 stop:1311 length:981 start_codon:yes stop_codon:yes gene_type:complete
MNYFLSIFVFICVLFFYIHIYHHYKTSNDLEIYKIDNNPTNERLEEVCNIKQPFVFYINNTDLLDMFNLDFLIKRFGQFDIKIRNVNNYDDTTQMYLPFQLEKSEMLLKNDKKNKFITENNSEFINETGLEKFLSVNDEFLKPPLLSNTYYDFVTGSEYTTTPLRHFVNYRNYICVTSGALKLKLICPSDTKYLSKEKDYENFEFRSPINVWNVQEDYKNNFGKVRIVDVELKRGAVLHIPAYWWYSVKFGKDTSYLVFNYRTYMNNVALIPDLCVHFLQRQNIKHNSMQKFIEDKEVDEEIIITEEIEEKSDKNDNVKDEISKVD